MDNLLKYHSQPPLLAKDARNGAPRNVHCQVNVKGSGRGRPLHTGVASRCGQPGAAVPTWVRGHAGFVAGVGMLRLRREALTVLPDFAQHDRSLGVW
jgi:hypothetical protein